MKRFLSLLLVAAMVLSVPVMPVFAGTNTTAQEENVTPMTDICPCGCGKKIEEVDWTPMPTGYMGSIPEGHHYLTQDYVQGTYGMTIIAGTKVIIDLRGHTWTSTDTKNRILTVQGDMWLMDTVGGGKLAPKFAKTYGGAILVDAYEVASPSFTLVSGTITAAEGGEMPNGAGFIYAWEDSKFIMLGGVIENIDTKDYGGAIMAGDTASIEILGGIIRNCSAGIRGGAIYSASTTPVVVKNTTFINNTVNVNTAANNGGGAVYSVPGLTVENCTFMGNSSTSDGGALYAAGGLDMKNSTFIGNSANNGGDLGCSGTATAVVDGCSFYGGYSTLHGGSIYANNANLTIKNTEMMGAIADRQGGHIYQYGGTLNIEDSQLNGGISNWAGTSTPPYCGGGNLMVLAGTTAATTTIEDSVIRNGFSKARGGNIQLSSDTTTFTLKNSTVTGGVAKYRGNNIEAQSSMTITIDGSTIDGDVALTGKTKPITLKGKVKIGLRNNGLALGDNANIDASALAEGSEVYISGAGNLVAAGANMDYFKGAIRTALSAGEGGVIVGTAGAGYCPHCGEIVTWEVLQDLSEEESLSGHYYVAESSNADTDYTYNGVDVVIDLNGKTISDTKSRAFTTRVTNGACTLSILDSAGNGFVKGYGPGNSYNGGVLLNNGVMNIYGGTYSLADKGYVKQGGVIYNGGTLNIYGGFFDSSKYENTTKDAGLGGTVCIPSSKTITIRAGHFVGGKGYSGGNLYISTGVTAEITGGTFVNGSASNAAGNLFFGESTTGSVLVKDIVVRGGTATTSAGNLRPGKYATNTFTNCYIAGGKASYGGNISVGNSNATIADCVIYGGEASSTGYGGGNVYTATLDGAIKLDGCLITGGTAAGNGGNIRFNHGNHQILGGEVSYGTARVGGNMYLNAGNYATGTYVTTIQKNAEGEVPQIFGGSASYGGNLSVVGTVVLNDAVIYGGEATDAGADIQLTKLSDAKADPKLTMGNGVVGGANGEISMIAPTGEGVYGTAIRYTVSNGLNEKAVIVLEGDYGRPNILAKGGVLRVAGAQVVDAEDKETWYVDYADAAAAVSEGGYVKLFADAQLIVTKDTYVDLNGHKVTVTGSGNLLGMDTSGDNYDEPKGEVTFAGTSPVADKSMVYAPNGNKYVALVEDSTVTYHRLGADLTTVTIDVDNNGVYFKGIFGADDTLKAMIDTYGIAVSLTEMPMAGKIDETIKTSFSGADMKNRVTASGLEKDDEGIISGVIITNVLKHTLTATENADRGDDKIYASTYVKLTDGTTVFMGDDASNAEDDVAWSLQDALVRLDELIKDDPTYFRRYTNDMRAFYSKWKELGMSQLITNEKTNFIAPEKDDVIDVLMIGSSSCYYYVEEMASLAAAAGIKLRVCNVYYSGCPINKYYEDWKNNYADYQFFDTTAEEQPDGTIKATRKVLGGGKTLEWCLAQGDWDVISMQSRGALVMRDYLNSKDHLEAEDIKEATEVLFPYIHEQFPDAKLYLREQAAYQKGKNLSLGNGTSYAFNTLEDQQKYAAAQKDASDRMVEKFNAAPYNLDMGIMRDAEAGMFVREGFRKADESGTWEPYDDLCARIGFRPGTGDTSFNKNDPNEGDHGHAGDIGGGQYLEGAQWLQRIVMDVGDKFGIEDHDKFDVRTITWVPTYYKSKVVVENRFNAQQLREAAYKAATEGWTPPAKFVSPVK